MDSKNLNEFNYAISRLEDLGLIDEATELHNIFVKQAAKKKKKNIPNNPSLWAECKAWAKRTFDVYPCVPLDSMALTKKGWAEYSDLNIGDSILTYNQSIDKLEWKPVLDLHFYEDAPTLSMKKAQTNFKVRCTPDHKWVLKTPNVKHPDNLVEAKNITKRMNLKTAAEIVDHVNENLDLSKWRKGDDWVQNILNMSKPQLEAFFAAGIVYDGHDKGLSSLNRSTYGFSQKNINHGEAMEIAAVLLGYRVSFVQKMHNSEMKSWTFIKRDSESTGNLIIEEDLSCDVWCPQTENNTWVMKQGRIITITGNSAYANGAASKRYKSKGGTWKKASDDSYIKSAQIAGGQNYNESIGTKASDLMNRMNFSRYSGDDNFTELQDEYLNNFENFNATERAAIRKTLDKFFTNPYYSNIQSKKNTPSFVNELALPKQPVQQREFGEDFLPTQDRKPIYNNQLALPKEPVQQREFGEDFLPKSSEYGQQPQININFEPTVSRKPVLDNNKLFIKKPILQNEINEEDIFRLKK